MSSHGKVSLDQQNRIWQSVFMIREKGGGSSASTKVWDIFDSHLYLLVNLHFMIGVNGNNLSKDFNKNIKKYCADNKESKPASTFEELDIATSDGDGGELIVLLAFEVEKSMCHHVNCDYDVVILKVPLNDGDWEIGNGTMTRKCTEEPSLNSLKRKRKPVVKDDSVIAGTTVMKIPRCAVRVPDTTEQVFVFGYPAMNRAKTVKHSAVSSHITQFCFTVDFLSAPGMSGSAIIADATGHIVGYLGGNYDSSAKNDQFCSYAYAIGLLPRRPSSSRTNSPERNSHSSGP